MGCPSPRRLWQAERPLPSLARAPLHGAPQLSGMRQPGQRGQGARVPSQHVSRFLASSSRLPQAGDCHEFQPQTFPKQPQRKHPCPGAPPGSPCGSWLPSRRLGGRRAGLGLPALFGFPLPALEPQTPVSPRRRPDLGKGTKALHSQAGESRMQGKRAAGWIPPPVRPHHAHPRTSLPQHGSLHARCPATGLLCAPELFSCLF